MNEKRQTEHIENQSKSKLFDFQQNFDFQQLPWFGLVWFCFASKRARSQPSRAQETNGSNRNFKLPLVIVPINEWYAFVDERIQIIKIESFDSCICRHLS